PFEDLAPLSPRPLLIDAGWQLALLGGLLALVAVALMPLVGLGWHGLAAALVAYAGMAALVLAGVDGWAARRSGFASRFGARFDMESDALFVLALAALVYRTGQAGAWVLTLGAMRYIFVAAGRL